MITRTASTTEHDTPDRIPQVVYRQESLRTRELHQRREAIAKKGAFGRALAWLNAAEQPSREERVRYGSRRWATAGAATIAAAALTVKAFFGPEAAAETDRIPDTHSAELITAVEAITIAENANLRKSPFVDHSEIGNNLITEMKDGVTLKIGEVYELPASQSGDANGTWYGFEPADLDPEELAKLEQAAGDDSLDSQPVIWVNHQNVTVETSGQTSSVEPTK